MPPTGPLPLRSLRRSLSLTAAELADRLGMNPSNYVALERGRRALGLKTARRVCDALGVRAVLEPGSDAFSFEAPVEASQEAHTVSAEVPLKITGGWHPERILPHAPRITREIGGYRVTLDYFAGEVIITPRKKNGKWASSSLLAFAYFRAHARMDPERVFDLVERQLSR